MKNIPEIVRKYRTKHDASLRAFADMLSGNAPQSVTHQTVSNWENGVHPPSYMYLLSLALFNDDWRREFALECLAVVKPEYYAPDTNIAQESQR